jgi:hypothetical protein
VLRQVKSATIAYKVFHFSQQKVKEPLRVVSAHLKVFEVAASFLRDSMPQ